MNEQMIYDALREALWISVKMSTPLLVVGLVVGLAIGLFQALTSIQEATLVYVPKILAIFITLLIAFPFMGAVLDGYTHRIMDKIVAGG